MSYDVGAQMTLCAFFIFAEMSCVRIITAKIMQFPLIFTRVTYICIVDQTKGHFIFHTKLILEKEWEIEFKQVFVLLNWTSTFDRVTCNYVSIINMRQLH